LLITELITTAREVQKAHQSPSAFRSQLLKCNAIRRLDQPRLERAARKRHRKKEFGKWLLLKHSVCILQQDA
jgi:hypothetical protein